MGKSFAFVGNETVGAMVKGRLEAALYECVDPSNAEVVLTYCTSNTELEDVYFDEKGLVQVAQKGALLIDLSPATPNFARELNAVATVSDLAAVDAPLMVADIACPHAFADKYNLTCFVGGDEEDVVSARPLVEELVGVVKETGEAGSAQLARAAYTLHITAQVVSAIEASSLFYAVCHSFAGYRGVSDALKGSTMPAAEQVLSAVNAGTFDGDYTVEMFMAELTAALTAADDVDLILPQAEACLHLLELLAVIGGADKAPSSLALVYGEEARCAEQGLDWTRAEKAYDRRGDDDCYGSCEGDEECDCGYEYNHDDGYGDTYPPYPNYGAYSAN